MNTESLPRTLLLATCVALFCSALVSVAVSYFRPMQLAYASTDRARAILEAAGTLPGKAASERDIAIAYAALDVRIVDLGSETAVAASGAHAFDHWRLSGESDAAAAAFERAPVYLVTDGERVQRIVLPVSGKGMWSTLYAYIALADDFNTIAAVSIYRHGETPGIGDRIEDAAWLETWRNKRLSDGRDGRLDVQFRVAENAADRFGVDAISGATITSVAVGAMVQDWLGPDGFGPLLAELRQGSAEDLL